MVLTIIALPKLLDGVVDFSPAPPLAQAPDPFDRADPFASPRASGQDATPTLAEIKRAQDAAWVKANEQSASTYAGPPPALRSSPARTYSSSAFRNCNAARAAGAAPVYRGGPGYGPHLDRDSDGIGCEPIYRR